MVVTATYDPSLVALSILVAGFASYTALDLGGRVALAQGPTHRIPTHPIWPAAAALTITSSVARAHGAPASSLAASSWGSASSPCTTPAWPPCGGPSN